MAVPRPEQIFPFLSISWPLREQTGGLRAMGYFGRGVYQFSRTDNPLGLLDQVLHLGSF